MHRIIGSGNGNRAGRTRRAGRSAAAASAAALLLAASAAPAQEGGNPGRRFATIRPGLDGLARVEAARNLDLGSAAAAPGEDDSRTLVRLRPAVETGMDNAWQGRLEGQWYGIAGRQDESGLAVYQGFLDGELPGSGGRVRAKAGRQELVYGSAFLLGSDTFYDGQSWDAVKISAQPADGLSVDLFGARYVKRNSGGIEGTIYGIYSKASPRPGFSLDLYALRDGGGPGATRRGSGHEVTWSIGARVLARLGEGIELEAEPVRQFGRKPLDAGGHEAIDAFGGHVDLSWRPDPARLPGRLFGGFAWSTGDGNPSDGRFREFHNPNNDTPQIGDMNVIGDIGGLSVAGNAASGLRIVTAGAAADLPGGVAVTLSGRAVRAVRAPAGFSRDVGIEADLTAAWTVREGLCVTIGLDRFFTGGFFRDATGGGRDIDFGYLQLQAAI